MTRIVQELLRRIWFFTLTTALYIAGAIVSLWEDLLKEGTQGFAWTTSLHTGQRIGIPGLFTWLLGLGTFTGSRRWRRFPWSGLAGTSTRGITLAY